MKHTIKFIFIILSISLNQVLASEVQQDCTPPHKNISLSVLQDVLPQIGPIVRSLPYDPISNTFTLTLDDRQLDDKSQYKIVGMINGVSVVDVESDADDIKLICKDNKNFILTNTRYAIGVCDKNLSIICSGDLTISNLVRANKIYTEASSIYFHGQS